MRIDVFVVCGWVALAGCREKPIDPMARERRVPLVVAEQPPLPEDPVAGKRSEAQWTKHLKAEEVERRMAFDNNRVPEHRVLIDRIKAARERLDRPKTPRELEQTRAQLTASLTAIQADIDALDRWKNSSHILTDYNALMAALNGAYPAARLAAMGGNAAPLRQARDDFDAHLRVMHTWLQRLNGDMDEALEEGAEE